MNNQICELENGSLEFTAYESFHFKAGGSINPLVLVYETYGQLNSEKDNAIIVHHALSTSSHLAATEKKPGKGWWDDMVGRELQIKRRGLPVPNDIMGVARANGVAEYHGAQAPGGDQQPATLTAEYKPASGEEQPADLTAGSLTVDGPTQES